MKVLFAVWELAPFFKVGGLGDIARSLPVALHKLGTDIRTVIPYYKNIHLFNKKPKKVTEFYIDYDNKKIKITVFQISYLLNDIPVYLLKNHPYFDVPTQETFAVFALSIVKLLKENLLSWTPEIIHCNDHHTGFIPFLIKHEKLSFKTITTIHNLDHQGQADIDIVKKMGIDNAKCRVMKWEISKKKINFLIEAIIHSDIVNTVSPTYAKEIMTERYGAGLDEILRCESNKITGILNGIDYDVSDPATDKYLTHHYNTSNFLDGKRLNKLYLQKKLGLTIDKNIPMVGFIGRFSAKQKGIDILHKLIKRLNGQHYQFVILGKGDEDWEERFLWFKRFYPHNICCKFYFDEALASQIYAASDFLLIPSKFEPCGLVQMVAMRYGVLPIARATGGLKDSITDGIDGFLFSGSYSYSLEESLKRAVDIQKNHRERYKKMVLAAMNKDFSWDASAKKYVELYEKLLCKPSGIF